MMTEAPARFKKLGGDSRGSVYEFYMGNTAAHLIYTNKGYLRGGDYHPSDTFCLFVSGRGRWTVREDGKERSFMQEAGEMKLLPANKPHILEALDDYVMIEWLSKEGPFQVAYDPEMRAALVRRNDELSASKRK